MGTDHFQKGLANIREELQMALTARKVERSVINMEAFGDRTRFSVTVDDKTESQNFLREEIEDSGISIDAPVALKIRMLVSHFVR